jgi:hypothetical protein
MLFFSYFPHEIAALVLWCSRYDFTPDTKINQKGDFHISLNQMINEMKVIALSHRAMSSSTFFLRFLIQLKTLPSL